MGGGAIADADAMGGGTIADADAMGGWTMADSVLKAFRQTSLEKQGRTDGRANALRAMKASSTARLALETKKKRAEAQRRREEDRDKTKTDMEKEVWRRRAEDAKIAELALRAEEDARLAVAREAYARTAGLGGAAALGAVVAEIDNRRAACALAVKVSYGDTSAGAAKKRSAAEEARRAQADDWYADSLVYFRASITEIARRRACADATSKAAPDAKMAAYDPEEAARDDAMRRQVAEEDARRCDEDVFLWDKVEGSLRITAAAAARLEEAEAEILACAEGASEQMVTAESICSETEDTRGVVAQRDVGDADTDTEDTRGVVAQRDVGDADTDTEDTRGVAAQRDVGDADTDTEDTRGVAAQRDVDDADTSTPMLRAPAPAPAPESYDSKVKSLATKLLDGPLQGLKMPGTQNLVQNHVVESIIATCFARFEPGFAEIIFNSHTTGQEVSLKTLRGNLRLVGAAAERALDAFTARRFCVYYFEADIGRDADISFGERYLAFKAFLKESDERTSAKYTGKAASMTVWKRALQHLDLRLSGTAVWKDVLADLKEDLEKGITWRLTLTLLLDDFDVDALAGEFKLNMSPTCTLSEIVLMATVRSVSRDALGGFGTNINAGVRGVRVKGKDEFGLGATPESFEVYSLLSELEGEDGMTVAEIADGCELTLGSVHEVMARHGGDDGHFLGFGPQPRRWRIRRDDERGRGSGDGTPRRWCRSSCPRSRARTA
jgi:hypothetical protein